MSGSEFTIRSCGSGHNFDIMDLGGAITLSCLKHLLGAWTLATAAQQSRLLKLLPSSAPY